MSTAPSTLSNSIPDPIVSPFAQKASTRTFGNRNSWSVFGPNQPHELDDFMPNQKFESIHDNDLDLIQTRKTTTQPTTTTTTTTKYSPTFSSIIAPKPANSMDM